MAEERMISQEEEFAEERSSLWQNTFGPLIWAAHFILCYGATALVCQKMPEAILPLRWAIAALTLAASAGILRVGWPGSNGTFWTITIMSTTTAAARTGTNSSAMPRSCWLSCRLSARSTPACRRSLRGPADERRRHARSVGVGAKRGDAVSPVVRTLAILAALAGAAGGSVVAFGLYDTSARDGHWPGVGWLLHTTFRNSVELRAPPPEGCRS